MKTLRPRRVFVDRNASGRHHCVAFNVQQLAQPCGLIFSVASRLSLFSQDARGAPIRSEPEIPP